MAPPRELDVVVPVYREAATIAGTLRAIAAAVAPLATYRFVVAEDPGGDDTRSILEALEASLPITIAGASHRRGYSRAMRDALAMADAPFILCIDSDRQYEPDDIETLWRYRLDADMVIGCRTRRAEGPVRRLGSRSFGWLVRVLFSLRTQDPSSSLVLMNRTALRAVLPRVEHMPEAFWWEVSAQAGRLGLHIVDVPVRHYHRAGGPTRVYGVANLPGVVWRQVRALIRMWRHRDELR
jgi:glycosyltransferase involved in cell wall biosynthesis